MSDDQALINLANRVRSNHCEPGTDRSAYLLAVNVLNRLALSAPSEPVPDGPRVLGYIVATKGADGFWHDDWDGKVHVDLSTGKAALAECRDFGCESTLAILTEVVEEATP